jgi:hypothetical protein
MEEVAAPSKNGLASPFQTGEQGSSAATTVLLSWLL